MAKKQFKAESKRLLDLMINSIYTHKEIFLRELISNASDALDKLYFKSLTDTSVGTDKGDFNINIEIDKDKREIKITDNGIGMTENELENNLGIIAKSGSLAFKQENEKQEDVDIIGQFGVGFYSAFMVSDLVTVKTRAFGNDQGFMWESTGAEGYSIKGCEKETIGSEITLKLKENTENDNYDEFLDEYRIQNLIKKYSDYIRYPIKMEIKKQRLKEGSDKDYEDYSEVETLNSMVPIWRKNKTELKQEDYDSFYKEKFFDYENPLATIHSKTEGSATYDALMFIPAKTPFNYYSKEFEKGLQLYSKGVLIMDKCADLLPDYFSFVRGLVDSEDLSLNISREMLQHDRQLKIIAKSIEKKIKSELVKMLKNEREKYEEFFKNFGLQIKFGIYNGYGMNKDQLKELLMFVSSKENKLVTIDEYIESMSDEQKFIYFASGESIAKIEQLPQCEIVKEKGFEILYLTDDVDEFAIQMLHEYNGKEFKSVSSGDLGLESEEEKKQLVEKETENKDMFDFMAKTLDGKVKKVALSKRLTTHPVCLSSEGMLSLEMEKVLKAMPKGDEGNDIKAEKVLEINANHKIFETLKSLYENDKEKLEGYTKLLYTQALLIEGISIENPLEFSNSICDLMTD